MNLRFERILEREREIDSRKFYERLKRASNEFLQDLDDDELMELYKRVNLDFRKENFQKQIRTSAERVLFDFLKKHTGCEIFHSFFIGRHCVDIIIPSKGIIIEVDGGSHNFEQKIKKDIFRNLVVERFPNLYVMTVLNEDVFSNKRRILNLILKAKNLKSKEERKLMREIYIKTVWMNVK